MSDNINIIRILRFLKVNQPTDINSIIDSFEADLKKESLTIEENQIDILITVALNILQDKKLIIKSEKTKNYVLTSKGIELVPSNLTRYSSDVSRALALKKRKW